MKIKKKFLKKIEKTISQASIFFYRNTKDFETKELLLYDVETIKYLRNQVKKENNITSIQRRTLIEATERVMFYLSLPIENILQVKATEYNDYKKIEFLCYYNKNELYTEYSLPDFKEKLAKDIAKNNIKFDVLNESIKNEIDLNNNTITLKQFDRLLYCSLKDGLIRRALYVKHKEIKNFILYTLFNHFNSLTKHDTDVDTSTLTQEETQQAIKTSITKFTEIYYQQPKELKCVLIPYTETDTKEHIEVIGSMVQSYDNKDFDLLMSVFTKHKRDMQGRIYNYSLLDFLYYEYGLDVSFKHLFDSILLREIGVYKNDINRDTPSLKQNTIHTLENHIRVLKYSQYDINIYIKNLFDFVKVAKRQKINRYILSYLVDMSHNLKASKDFMKHLTTKDNFKNVTYDTLPQPINTLLIPYNQIAN